MLKNRKGIVAVLLAVFFVGVIVTLPSSLTGLAAAPAPVGKLGGNWQYAILGPNPSSVDLTQVELNRIHGSITEAQAAAQRMTIEARMRFESPSGTITADFYPELGVKLGGKDANSWSELLTDIGAQGWELVTVTSDRRFVFKRQSP
jgi:hypothetical protein